MLKRYKSKINTMLKFYIHNISNPDHIATDMQLIPIEKIFLSRDSIRKAREATLIIRAKTIEPNGLNARDERH